MYAIIPTLYNGWEKITQEVCGGYDEQCIEDISDFDGVWRAKCIGSLHSNSLRCKLLLHNIDRRMIPTVPTPHSLQTRKLS